jgi:hypothetical protein
MRLKPRKFAIAATLTAIAAMAGMASLPAAATASTPAISGFDCSPSYRPSFQMINHTSELWILSNGEANTQYFLETDTGPTGADYFCPDWGVTHSGTTYHYYDDNYGLCLTVSANTSPQYTYEETCGRYPASQEWVFLPRGAGGNGILENYDTSECLWAAGQPPVLDSAINVGACNLNENTGFIEEGAP